MNRVLSQCRKELNQFRRDRISVALAFLLPVITLLLFGFGTRLELKDLKLAIYDFDGGKQSREYIDRLFATRQLIPTRFTGGDPFSPLDQGIAKASLIIPPEFSRDIERRKTVQIQALVDATDVNNARVVKNILFGVNQFFLEANGLATTSGPLVPQVRLWFNPGREEALYIVPGTIAFVMWIFPSLLSSIAVSREKEHGTILQVYASSMTSMEFIGGKLLAYILVGVAEAAVVIAVSSLLFGVSIKGSIIIFVLNLFLFLSSSVNFGLFAGSVAHSQTAGVQIVATIGFTTALLLSGFIYPIRNIVFPLSLISNVVPTRYFIEGCRDAFVRGTDWQSHLYIPLALLIANLIIFCASTRKISAMQLEVE